MVILQPLMVLADTGQVPTWWQTTVGVLSIPASIIGLAYSWVLIRKTRLEARKTELEIREKEQELAEGVPSSSPPNHSSSPLAIDLQSSELQRVHQVFLRVLLIVVVLQVWRLAERFIRSLLDLIGIGYPSIPEASGVAIQVAFVIFLILLESIPEVGYWIVVIGLGWPVFTDTLDLLKFKVPQRLRSDKLDRIAMMVAAIVVVTNNILAGLRPV